MNKPDFNSLENIYSEDFQKNLDQIIHKYLDELKIYLGLAPITKKFKFKLTEKENLDFLGVKNIFKIGVKKENLNNISIIEINTKYFKFLPFIILREIYNLFIPFEILENESVQIVINQILMTDLSKNTSLNDWRSLIRENLEQYDSLSLGFNRLTEFDRLIKFFKLQEKKTSNTPTQFFFKYIREYTSLIREKIESFHNIIFDEYEKYFLKLMVNDDLIETIRCIIKIFYEVKRYKDLLSYKKHFKEFKEKNKLETNLSLRKFSEYMDWIKTETFIAPNYQLNYKLINVSFNTLFIRFNPILSKRKIYEFLDKFPFLIAPKISQISFAIELLGYVTIPKVYLEDFLKFIEKLKNRGYIIKYLCLSIDKAKFFTNLNYLKEYSQGQQLLDPQHPKYEKKFEIELKIDYGKKFYAKELSLLEFLIIDRIRFFSTSGFGFERRAETLKILKSDLINEVITQRSIIQNLKETSQKMISSNELKQNLYHFIESNSQFGFFYIKSFLEDFLVLAKKLNEFFSNNLDIENISQFHNVVKTQDISFSIEDNLILKNQTFKNIFLRELIPLYFQSKKKYDRIINRYKIFHELFNSCYNLKIFNLKSIKNLIEKENLIGTIYREKENRYNAIYDKSKPYRITNQEVDEILDEFVNNDPPIIQPKMLSTLPVSLYSQDFIYELTISESKENYNLIKTIKNFFPNVLITHARNLFSNKNYISVEIYTPNLTNEEKLKLNSIIYNNFKDNILFGKRFLWSGHIEGLTTRNLYDFEYKRFFYTKDLFEQFFKDVQKKFGPQLDILEEKEYKNKELNWPKDKNIINLVKSVNSRISHENYDFNITSLNKLLDFHFNLKDYLFQIENFKKKKQEYFFQNYIKSIKFIPAFQQFGFSNCFFYLNSTNMSELNLKLLLSNTFMRIRYPASIDNSNSIFISNIMPYEKPNISYLNWLAKAKKIIREYCVFFIKKIYLICHFNYNLSPNGWKLDKDRFKTYMQNILFNPKYHIEIPKIKEFSFEKKSTIINSPDTSEYKALTQVYNWQGIDIKSYIGTRKVSTINHINDLLKKNLIYPYLSLKNLELHNHVNIILPNLTQKFNQTLIKIFSFFNYGFIYEIEGEYYIYGFPKEIKFENGLMIKLYLPKCELHEFMKIFDLLFEYLEIKDYLILNDLVDGSELLKSIYGGLEFLKDYNPLKNLKWNSKDKQWMNHKLFTQKFEPIYPDLILKDKE